MHRKFFTSVLMMLLACTLSAQTGNTGLAKAYINQDNPHYWKNKIPHATYWQQDVHYRMKLNIDERTDILSGDEELIYVNNSPDTLHFVYFHLYQNAFQPGSYYDQLLKSNKSSYPYGSYQRQKMGTAVESMTIDDKELKTLSDNTIMKAWLPQPLLPGKQVTFKIKFKTYFDIHAPWGRMRVYNSYGYKHYNGAHFYPRIAVYDYRSGWDTDQHLGHEFYGEFGTYQVELTMANNFIVDATGTLTNESEVMPAALRKKLDITNFRKVPQGEPPSVIIPYDSTKRKTWKFEAMNVHDFAFLADPTFRIGEAGWNGIKCIALVCEPNAPYWQDAAQITADIIKIYSEDFGMYAYPKMIVSDAQSGMEYPMLTMDGGKSPDYIYLFAHEIGHNWFYGMVGSNETYQAAMDEGFTQFLTIWALERLQAKYVISSPDPADFIENRRKHLPLRYDGAYDSYFDNAIKTEGVQLNTHSDMFKARSNYGSEYRQTYNKTAVMLFNLQYALGDEEFGRVMKTYFQRWSFCHPHLNDFRLAVNHTTHANFDWFFDQWLETNKTIDYGIRCVRKHCKKGEYTISFCRRGDMQMPIDFTVFGKNDTAYSFHIPNSWYVKKTDATILPRWTGWMRYNRKYKADVAIPGGIRDVVIDTTSRLADINMCDNRLRRPVTMDFDYMIENPADWKTYEFYGRPDIWYNGFDGIKAGLHLEGSYMRYIHRMEAGAWVNTSMLQQPIGNDKHPIGYNWFSYTLAYETPLKFLSRSTFIKLGARSLDGVNIYSAGLEKRSKSGDHVFSAGFKSLSLIRLNSLNYLLYPEQWDFIAEDGTTNYNNTINLKYKYSYQKNNSLGSLDVLLRSSAFGNDINWASISVAFKHLHKIWRFHLRTRVFAQYAAGKSIPAESSLYLAGANPEELLENKYTRASGIVPSEWVGYGITTNHFHAGGGLNLRGYAGYLVAHDLANGLVIPVYKGHSGAAVNIELDLDRLISFRPRGLREWLKWNIYLFGDAGVISSNEISQYKEFADLRADAGLGTAITIKKWWRLDKFKPLILRFDMPLFLNRPPAADPDFFKFRWVVGMNRTF